MRRMTPVSVALLLGFYCNTGMATVPNPTVIGPIPATAAPGDPSHAYPFFSTTVDLAAYDYVEEEFFLQGTANRYNTPPLATGSIIDSGHLYKTRIVVRRPSPDDFNGTVVMEWQNVTLNHDLDAGWLESRDHLIRRGYAWVGVSAQHAGIDSPVTGLKAWSPNRYRTLDVTQGGRTSKSRRSDRRWSLRAIASATHSAASACRSTPSPPPPTPASIRVRGPAIRTARISLLMPRHSLSCIPITGLTSARSPTGHTTT